MTAASPSTDARTPRRATRAQVAYRTVEHWVVVIHRWLGIVTCLLSAVWFISGLVMIYVEYPKLTPQELRRGLAPIDWAQVRADPDQAMAAAGLKAFPQDLRLEMSAGRPVYRIQDRKGRAVTVSAIDGRVIGPIGPAEATRIAAAFSGRPDPVWKAHLDEDSWSFSDPMRPVKTFHVVSLQDPAGTNLYVSAATGEVILDTTRRERTLNWFGTALHLLDLAPLRANQAIWRPFFMTTTVLATIVALSGLWVGVSRLSLRKRYADGAVSPFRGYMYWHHILGVLGGLFLLFWTASAWLYLRPNHLLERKPTPPAALAAYAGHTAPTVPTSLGTLQALTPADVQVIRFSWVNGRPLAVAADRRGGRAAIDLRAGHVASPAQGDIVAAARRLVPAAAMQVSRLEAPDEYWHTFRLTFRKLPILRVAFDDAAGTWFHIDPDTGEIVNTSSREDRIFRWLFNGLHKFDFLVLVKLGRVRDMVLVPLMLVGGAISITGVVIGWRYLIRPRRPRRKTATAG